MNVILGPRASGKTTEAIEVAQEKDAYLAVRNEARKRDIEARHDVDAITYQDLINGTLEGRYPRQVVLDNAGEFLHHVTGSADIDTVTMTHEDITVLHGGDR